MSEKVKQDDKNRIEREHRALRGEGWHFGMPFEGEDEDFEDFEEEIFNMREVGGMRDQMWDMRTNLDHFHGDEDDLDDPFNQGFDLLERFDGGMLGQRNPFEEDFIVDERFHRGPFIAGAPPRRQRRRQEEPDPDRVRVVPLRANVMRQQEAMFNHQEGERPWINLRERPAAERRNTGAERVVPRPRQPTDGAQRLGRMPAAEAARAAALARPRRGT